MRRHPKPTERASLDVFEALGGPIAARDQRDLMERPFFSLAKAADSGLMPPPIPE